MAEFDSTLYIDLNTGKLPLPLDVAARIAIRFRTSPDLVYKKVLQDPHMFEEFFQIEDLNEKIQKFEVKEDADTSEQKIEDECHSFTKVTATLLVSNYTLESSRINQKYGVTENGEDKQCGQVLDRFMLIEGVFALTTLDDTFTNPIVIQEQHTKPKKCVESLYDYPEAKVVESSSDGRVFNIRIR